MIPRRHQRQSGLFRYAVLCALLFVGCEVPPGHPTGECPDWETESASAAPALGKVGMMALSCEGPPWYPWNKRPPAAYTYTFMRNCFCFPDRLGPFYVKVEDGVVTRAFRVASEGDFAAAGDTVEATGSLQSYALDSIWSQSRAWLSQPYASAYARYDSTWGFPDSFYIDFASNLADDEYGFTVTDFHELED